MFFYFPFRFLNKKYSNFSQKKFSRIRENRSTCPEEESMKMYETEKELINKTFSMNLFWQLSDFWWNFSDHFVKTVFYLRVTFWRKAKNVSEILIGSFFGHWAQTLTVLAKLLPAQLYKLLSTCLKGRKLWVQIFEKKLWFWKFL